jgi:DNA-binding MltR family transcriptional regulator
MTESKLFSYCKCPISSQNAIDRVFGLNGPLNTFSSRILIAYHLGWINNEQRGRLNAFRSIRNAFAHRAFEISITDPEIRGHLAVLDHGLTEMYASLTVAIPTQPFKPNLLCNLIVLALRTFEQLLVFPIARAHEA